jgi:hypothetical protein
MRIQSLLIGAAIAAFVILPAQAGEGWVTGQWQTYNTKALDLENVVATVKVDVKDTGPMAVQVSGLRERVNGVKVYADNGRLMVKCQQINTVWDWQHWFDFSQTNINKPSQLVIHVVVPRGSPVDVEAMAGNVTIGDTMGPLKFEVMGYSESTVGNVTLANLAMEGSGKLKVGNVSGAVHAETDGSGDIRIGDVGKINAEIAGSGSITVGRISGPLNVSIAGSGDFSGANVQGPTSVEIAGSGSVTVAGGEANPFNVDIMGSGNVNFGGTVVNPKIDTMGSGSVRAKACRGSSCNDSDLKISG